MTDRARGHVCLPTIAMTTERRLYPIVSIERVWRQPSSIGLARALQRRVGLASGVHAARLRKIERAYALTLLLLLIATPNVCNAQTLQQRCAGSDIDDRVAIDTSPPTCVRTEASDTAVSTNAAVAPHGNALQPIESIEVAADGHSIHLTHGDVHRSCSLEEPATHARLSSDGSAIIISSSAYVSLESLYACGKRPLRAVNAPADMGTLADVSIPGNVYVGMVLTSVRPLSYSALVARLGSTRSLVSLPGAYVDNTAVSRLQQHSFHYDENVGPFPMISKDGRYVAIDGRVDCSAASRLGVWDIHRNRKVILKGSSQAQRLACQALFSAARLEDSLR